MFYLPKGRLLADTSRGPIIFTYLCIILSLETYIGLSIYRRIFASLRPWKFFIPRREAAKAAPKGSNWYSFHFLGVGNGTGGFIFTDGFLPFRKLENVLSPGGMLRKQLPVGVQLTLFTFYWCRKRYWGFQIYKRFFAILKTWICFIPRRDVCLQTPVGVQLVLLMFYFGLVKL